MRYMGIDFGSKRVGIALSDEDGRLAFPHATLENSPGLLLEVGDIGRKNGIGGIVMGESKNFQGEYNKIMESAFVFKTDLERELKIPVSLEPEFLTSAEADRQARSNKPDPRIREGGIRIQKKDSLLDASAAALILQSYLDKKNNKTADSGK